MNEELLKEAKYFAGLLLTDVELDQVLELEPGTVERSVSNHDNELGKAIRAGRLLTKCELNESILTTARRHSTPAQQMAAELLRSLNSQ